MGKVVDLKGLTMGSGPFWRSIVICTKLVRCQVFFVPVAWLILFEDVWGQKLIAPENPVFITLESRMNVVGPKFITFGLFSSVYRIIKSPTYVS